MYDAVEEFLQIHNNLMPIRYSYSEIKKMATSFTDKLVKEALALHIRKHFKVADLQL